jgi:CO/xanthine dehydrogenase Mo-binding subunit
MTVTAAEPPPAVLPPLLKDNPRLDQWVRFETPGRVTVSTGRVEIGQGVLTAMLQIAADELDVSPDRIDLRTGDTTLTPDEGYTAGSQSIQFGGIAMRLVCAEVRSLFLAAAASRLGCAAADLSVEDGAVFRHGKTTGEDYWSLADTVDLVRPATASAAIKLANDCRVVGRNASRVDLAAKVFGAPISIHDMKLDGMVHARVVRQPRRGGTVAKINQAAIRRAGKGKIQIIRHGNSSPSFVPTKPPSMPLPLWRPDMLPGTGTIRSTRCRRRRGGCSNSRRSINRLARRCRMTRCEPITRQPLVGCTLPTPRSGHPAGWQSIATANCRCGRIARASIRYARHWPAH